jgi:hypothetical protein
MPADLSSALLLAFTCAVTFLLARVLSRRWRERRRDREERASRGGESRQVRRARERRGGKQTPPKERPP